MRYNEFKSVQSGRNSILLPYKNMPLGMLLLNFIPLALGYLLKILVFGLRGFWTPYIKGAREAFRAIPKVKKAEIPVAQSAPLRAHRAVAGGGCVPLHRLPHHAVFLR